jgi:DNA/RNA endonuclease G (NUC1)
MKLSFTRLSILRTKILMLFVVISYNLFGQIYIKPYSVYFDYKNKIAVEVSYTVIKPICKPKGRTFTFHKSPGSLSPKDFIGIGYDKGHLFPANLAKDYQELNNSYDMKNIVAQDPSLNRGLWRSLELRIENYARTNDSVQVKVFCIGVKEVIGKVSVPFCFRKELFIWKNGELIGYEGFEFLNVKPVKSNIMFYKLN